MGLSELQGHGAGSAEPPKALKSSPKLLPTLRKTIH
jgi:hypothetical protein